MSGRPFLDRPAARLLALLCAALCLGLLSYIHRDDLFPTRASTDAASEDPFARCFSARAADVARMRAEGVINDAQEALFRSRAEAFCRAQTDDRGGSPPGAPTLPFE